MWKFQTGIHTESVAALLIVLTLTRLPLPAAIAPRSLRIPSSADEARTVVTGGAGLGEGTDGAGWPCGWVEAIGATGTTDTLELA